MNNSKDWIAYSNVYEVNIRQYTREGTFAAFGQHLPRLKDMGVQTLWFMPVTPISEKLKKGALGSYYACSDYCAINPEFGSLKDFRQLVLSAHDMGFKVIIDWVANHTGWDHKWTKEHADWYEKDEATGDFKRASGMNDIIELDFKNKDMRLEMIKSMKYWIDECDIDGFRCDLAFWVELDFWQEAIPQLNKIKPLFWLAELDPIDNPAYMEVFDAAYTWTWMHKTEDYCKKNLPFSELMNLLEKYESAPGIKAWFTSNHDENSWNGTEYEKYGPLAKVLAIFSCTWKGIPLIYSGQELPNLKRLEFFEKDLIEWSSNIELHSFYKKLLQLNTNYPSLKSDQSVKLNQLESTGNTLSYSRNGEVIVLLNFSAKKVNLILLEEILTGYKDLFTDKTVDLLNSIELEPFGYLVLLRIH
jgi:alpha-amylase